MHKVTLYENKKKYSFNIMSVNRQPTFRDKIIIKNVNFLIYKEKER